MIKKFEFQIGAESAGRRIDLQASVLSGLTRSQIKRLIDKGDLTVNGLQPRANYRTKTGDLIKIEFHDEVKSLIPEDLDIEILFSDEFIMVVNKPPGLVVYPAAGHNSGTLMNAVAFHTRKLSAIGAPLRPGVVHRLDKDTSGVMVVALEDSAYYSLVEQFRERTINRIYTALVFGSLTKNTGTINKKIGRSVSDRKKMSTKAHKGKDAVTTWRVIERYKDASLVETRLGTGRTHQIRVHFASIGHPVLGDRTYGRKTFIESKKNKIIFPRQMLHAGLLGITHPSTGEYMEFTCKMPPDMSGCISELQKAKGVPD